MSETYRNVKFLINSKSKTQMPFAFFHLFQSFMLYNILGCVRVFLSEKYPLSYGRCWGGNNSPERWQTVPQSSISIFLSNND